MDHPDDPTRTELALLLDEREIANLIVRVARAQDSRDWAAYQGCFAERVTVEQPMDPSWNRAEVTAAEWTQRAAATLDGFDLTQHVVSNLQIFQHGDRADAEVELIARHEIDGVAEPSYTVGGRYYITLRRMPGGWRIVRRRLQVNWETGNGDLMRLARERVAARA